METQGEGPDICDDSFVISFSPSKSICSYALESHLRSRCNLGLANNKGFDCRGLLIGVKATLSCLRRDHTEKKSRAEFYLEDGGDPEHGLSQGLSG